MSILTKNNDFDALSLNRQIFNINLLLHQAELDQGA